MANERDGPTDEQRLGAAFGRWLATTRHVKGLVASAYDPEDAPSADLPPHPSPYDIIGALAVGVADGLAWTHIAADDRAGYEAAVAHFANVLGGEAPQAWARCKDDMKRAE